MNYKLDKIKNYMHLSNKVNTTEAKGETAIL